MRPSKKFTFRVFLYSALLLYLAGDLFVFRGPVKRQIDAARSDSPAAVERDRAQGLVARVLGEPVYRTQVEREFLERLWLRGKLPEDLTPEQRRIERLAALNELIDHQLLRVKVKHHMNELPVSEGEIDEALRRLASRFASKDEMRADLAAEGIDSERELRMRLGGRIQQHKYLEQLIADEIAVGEDEARTWFDEHADDFAIPGRVRARHLFVATLDTPSEVARAKLEQAGARLDGGAGFATLAAELSEDPRSARKGGQLGWMTRGRLPSDFGDPLFEMEVGERRLLRTRIGWHLVELLERRPAERRSFGDARDEVFAALDGWKRSEMVRAFRKAERSRQREFIEVYPERIGSE